MLSRDKVELSTVLVDKFDPIDESLVKNVLTKMVFFNTTFYKKCYLVVFRLLMPLMQLISAEIRFKRRSEV